MQKIVTIGGGTGHFQLLKGLKNYECSITAIANMADDGGSSGRLRDEYGILPPGDARQCIVALAPENGGGRLRKLFNYRFKDGHNYGNLTIAALTDIYGGSAAGIKEAGRLLRISGEVLPVTIDNSILMAETLEGKVLKGQTEVSYPSDRNTKIKKLYYGPSAFIYRESAEAIRNADKVVICSGDLYGSILPNLIVEGMRDALNDSNAIKIYVCNLFTKQGNYDFKASNFIREIEKYSGVEMDKIIINVGRPSEDVVNKYFSEDSKLVEDDLGNDNRVIRGEFAREYLSEKKTILRHIPERIAGTIIGLD
mgnify:CR=1 FL=1